MFSPLELHQHDVHIWSKDLNIALDEEKKLFTLLDDDEQKRAKRFRFAKHQRRFIAARATLRHILSIYLRCAPQDIIFSYTQFNKPYLSVPHSSLQFNLSHSEEIAVYALTQQYAIGIDIEKTKECYNEHIAERFFSREEKVALSKLSSEERTTSFYRIWSRKEAVIKAVGKGLAIPISTFSVSSQDVMERVTLENQTWSIAPIAIHPSFQSAFATDQFIHHIYLWDFFNDEPRLNKVYGP